MKRVIIESPFAGATPEDAARNLAYARACLRDCLLRGEAPFASHLLYTQPGVLDDNNAVERAHGIAVGLEWGRSADVSAVYTDLGISSGMHQGIAAAKEHGRRLDFRSLGDADLRRLGLL